MKVSDKGEEFIKRNEGLRLTMYADSRGNQTIGWGHLVLPSDDIGVVITKSKAQELLEGDISEVEEDLAGVLEVQLSQEQFDALADFTFNLGITKLAGDRNHKRSPLLVKLNAGDFLGASQQFERWKFAGDQNGDGVVNQEDAIAGLLARRKREAKLFMEGDYGF